MRRTRVALLFAALCAVAIGASIFAAAVQRNFGSVEVTNVRFANAYRVEVRGKLFLPKSATAPKGSPGVVFIPGYQSLREAGDTIAIELARRGFVVLSIDAIGRGNSGVPPSDVNDPTFDDTFGGKAALGFLRELPFVDPLRVGIVGHSLGAQMAYTAGLADHSIKAVVMIGSAYDDRATPHEPANLLMIFGKYDEFRDRMTRTRDFEAEWMTSEETRAAFGLDSPKLSTTYGDFQAGTARRVISPRTFHETELHDRAVVAETVDWFRKALTNEIESTPPTGDQIWMLKEWATLLAMIASFATLIPLALLLIRSRFFSDLLNRRPFEYRCSKRDFAKFSIVNGLLMWLYLPTSMIVFAVHKFVVKIDGALPMMVVNVVVLWLLVTNLTGFLLFRRWARKRPEDTRELLFDLGIAFDPKQPSLPLNQIGKSALFAGLLFGFVYSAEYVLEKILIVDHRFIFSFANDLTPYRWEMFFLYFPLFLLGFLQLGIFLHGQLRSRPAATPLATFSSWSLRSLAVMLTPMLLLAAMQYVPLLATGAIPLVGPGGMFVLFVINIPHIAGVLAIIIPISTWLYLLTGRPYTGAVLTAAIVTWMFASSQVIAPVPI